MLRERSTSYAKPRRASRFFNRGGGQISEKLDTLEKHRKGLKTPTYKEKKLLQVHSPLAKKATNAAKSGQMASSIFSPEFSLHFFLFFGRGEGG